MTATLFSLLLIIVIALLARRRFAERKVKSEWKQEVGRSSDTPMRVSRFNEMDGFVRSNRCFCGGTPKIISEGTRTFDATTLRVIKGECIRCEEELYFFFQLDELSH